jgi:hypothetical protein
MPPPTFPSRTNYLGPLPSQTPSLSAPPPGTQGHPYYSPPGPSFQYGMPGQVGGGQYHAGGLGMMSTPPYYYAAPPHPPFSHQDNVRPWGYGQPFSGAGPLPFSQPGEARNVPVPVNETVPHTTLGGLDGTRETTPVAWPKKVYPNKQISDGGRSYSIKLTAYR